MQPQASMALTPYQRGVVALLAFLQFTVVLDFMILSPLGAILLKDLGLNTREFGTVVSAYAFSAGISGLLSAGFADRFDRKKWLLWFYVGFVVGTVLCGFAASYHGLLAARIVTGFFAGVVSSASLAIVADVFAPQLRGRVMGTIQSAFSASQVMGIPVGLWIANHFGWHWSFFGIALVCLPVGFGMLGMLKPLDSHLHLVEKAQPFTQRLVEAATNRRHIVGYAAILLLATGGFMLMPFASAFMVNNMKVSLQNLPLVYMVTGVFTMVSGPLLGQWGDKVGKFRLFWIASIATMILVLVYTGMGPSPLWLVMLVQVLLFMGIFGRMGSAQALLSTVPKPQDRGAYMAIQSSAQQISGGVASWIAGLVVIQSYDGTIIGYNTVGWIVAGSMLLTVWLMYRVEKL